MESIAALGLACNIIQVVELGSKLVYSAKEIYQSNAGATAENLSLEQTVNKLRNLSHTLVKHDLGATPEEQDLYSLATECKGICVDILNLLQRLKADPASKMQSAKSAFKNMLYKSEKQSLPERLEACRAKLHLQFDYVTSSQVKARLETLVQMSRDDSDKLQSIQTQLSSIQHDTAFLSPAALDQIKAIVRVSESTSDKIAQFQILNSLVFSDIHSRYDMVEEAHYRTFYWLFGESPDDEDDVDQNALSMGKVFTQWLASGRGIFHVSGKLGSGKSTLMKFLLKHANTKTELQHWAGRRKLVLASFFFWNPGTELQKSLAGFFRGLLHDILENSPELIGVAFPSQWQELKDLSHAQVSLCIRDEEVRIAFERLLNNESLESTHCFCFFLDGLDEYAETYQDDFHSVTKTLRGWTLKDHIKLCVSSREYNVFLNAFSESSRLYLHELTKSDITRYAEARLGDMQDSAAKRDLVTTIQSRSSGVFLYVALVTKTIRDGLTNDLSIETLHEELEALPDELDKLLRHLLFNKPRSDLERKRAFHTFSLLLILDRLTPLSLYQYSFLDEYERDACFAMKPDFVSVIPREQREQKAMKRIRGHHGLLDYQQSMRGSHVIFVHHSVVELLQRTDVKVEMQSYLLDFDTADACSQLFLAQLRSTPPRLWPRDVGSLVIEALSIRQKRLKTPDRPPYRYHETLTNVICETPGTSYKEWPDFGEILPQTKLSIGEMVNSGRGIGIDRSRKRRLICNTLLLSAAIEDTCYVMWRIQQDPRIVTSYNKGALLLCYALESGRDVHAEIIKALLEHGLPPNIPTASSPDTVCEETSKPPLTVWQLVLLDLIEKRGHPFYMSQEMPRKSGMVIKSFLQHGADPRILVSRVGSVDGNEIFTVEFAGRLYDFSVSTGDFMNGPLCQTFTEADSQVRFQQMYYWLWPLEDQKTMVQLIERNERLASEPHLDISVEKASLSNSNQVTENELKGRLPLSLAGGDWNWRFMLMLLTGLLLGALFSHMLSR